MIQFKTMKKGKKEKINRRMKALLVKNLCINL